MHRRFLCAAAGAALFTWSACGAEPDGGADEAEGGIALVRTGLERARAGMDARYRSEPGWHAMMAAGIAEMRAGMDDMHTGFGAMGMGQCGHVDEMMEPMGDGIADMQQGMDMMADAAADNDAAGAVCFLDGDDQMEDGLYMADATMHCLGIHHHMMGGVMGP